MSHIGNFSLVLSHKMTLKCSIHSFAFSYPSLCEVEGMLIRTQSTYIVLGSIVLTTTIINQGKKVRDSLPVISNCFSPNNLWYIQLILSCIVRKVWYKKSLEPPFLKLWSSTVFRRPEIPDYRLLILLSIGLTTLPLTLHVESYGWFLNVLFPPPLSPSLLPPPLFIFFEFKI